MSAVYKEEPKRLDFLTHLEELRRRILIIIVFFVLIAITLFSKGEYFLSILKRPIGTASELIFISPTEAFTSYLKIIFLASFIISFPVILFQLWAFMHPAFSGKRKNRIAVWLSSALVFFAAGILFSYFIAIPAALKFLLNFGSGIASPMITLGRYTSFVAALILVGGIVFEIPILIGLLTDIGILKADYLRKKRPQALIGIMIAAAIITPTQDILNMLMFAIPMVLLFEIGVILSKIIENKKIHKT